MRITVLDDDPGQKITQAASVTAFFSTVKRSNTALPPMMR